MSDTAKKAADDAVGCCKASVVKLDHKLATVCLVCNIAFPGVGTMVSACAGDDFKCMTLVNGLIQFFTSWLIFGWVWSIVHGLWIYKESK